MRFQPSRSTSIQKLFLFKESALLRRSAAGLILAMFVLLAATSTATGATIIYVDASASGAGTGGNWTDAYPKLQDALAAAASGDQIWVAAGVYYPDEGGGMTDDIQTSSFTLLSGVELYGGFAGGETTLGQRDWVANVTVLSGDIDQNDATDPSGVVTDVANIFGANAFHVMYGWSSLSRNAVLDGFTLTAGDANGTSKNQFGGGMFDENSSPILANLTFSGNRANIGGGLIVQDGSSPTLTQVTFAGNNAVVGGGMFNIGSDPTLTNVDFSGNQATDYGGGMYNDTATGTLNSVTFLNNQATDHGGGGMYNSESSPTLTDVTFSGNQAATDGGGMFNEVGSIPTLTNVIFQSNTANFAGGGISNIGSDPQLVNALFSGNRAPFGGGMANQSSSPSLSNADFSGNNADTNGGGMYNSLNSNPTLTNVILWNNQAGNAGPQIYNQSSIPVIAYSDIQGSGGSSTWDASLGTDGGNNIDDDPLFVTPVDPATAPTTAGGPAPASRFASRGRGG